MKIDRQKKSLHQEQKMVDVRRATSNLLKDIEEERTALVIAKKEKDALLASIGDGIIGTDKRGNIVEMNAAAEKIIGWTSGEVMGKNLFEIVVVEDEHEKTILKNQQAVSTVFKTGKAVVIDSTCFINKNGERVPVAINVTPIILSGKIIGTVNAFRDITEEKKLERAKNEFISLASHQLRTPITSMSWNLEILLSGDKGPLNKEQKGLMEAVYKSSKNMAELVGGFLDITKIESGGFVSEKGDVDLAQISDSVLAEIANQISSKKINITKKYGNNILHLDIGTKTAKIILQNLLTNAVKYTPENGSVEVKIEKTSQGTIISVKDNGYGIPEEAKSQIFSKLFRAENIREKEPSGTGLGLYLLKSLVDKLGGKVWFKSKEGVGTTFYVNLK